MNPYEPPQTPVAAPLPPSAEDDIAAAAPPFVARVAGGVLVLAALVLVLTAIQTSMMVRLFSPYDLVQDAQYVVGLPALVVGAVLSRARAWAAWAGIAASALMMIVGALWLVVSFSHGLFSLFAIAGPLVAVASGVLAILALAPCQRATRARARLAAQGMNLGL